MRVIAGTARGHPLRGPRGRATRPTADRVKEALFNLLGEAVAGAAVLDLYAGTGALGIEALSRGAASAVFVDRSPASVRLTRENLASTGLADRAEVLLGEAGATFRRLAAAGRTFQLVLADPPYAAGVAESLACLGGGGRLPAGALVAVELSAREELPVRAGTLALIRDRKYGDTRLGIYRVEG